MTWLSVAWRRRWTVALSALLAGGAAFGVSWFLPREYTAQAGVAVVRSRVRLKFDDKLRTLGGDELTALGSVALGKDLEARQRALVALVHDPAIAQGILDTAGHDIARAYGSPGRLLECVSVAMPSAELFSIQVTAADPVLAANLANTWAEEYEKKVNGIYASAITSDLAAAIEAELAKAWKAYQEAESELQAQLKKSDEPKLRARMRADEALAAEVSSVRCSLVRDVVLRVNDARMRVVEQHLAAAFEPSATLLERTLRAKIRCLEFAVDQGVEARLLREEGPFQALRDDLDELFRERRETADRLRDARALLAQVQEDRRVSPFRISTIGRLGLGRVGTELEVAPHEPSPPPTAEELVKEAHGVEKGLAERLRMIETEIQGRKDLLSAGRGLEVPAIDAGSLARVYADLFGRNEGEDAAAIAPSPDQEEALSRAMSEARRALEMSDVDFTAIEKGGTLGSSYERLLSRLRDTVAQVSAAESARTRQTVIRDAALELYSTLLRKKQEVDVAKTAGGSEVQVVLPAVPPEEPSFPRPGASAAVGALLGAFLAVLGASLGSGVPDASASRVLSDRQGTIA